MPKTIAEIVKDVEESARNDERKKIMSAMIENGDVDAWRRAVIRQKIVIDWDGSAQQSFAADSGNAPAKKATSRRKK